MAGSYKHITRSDGTFREDMGLIENMGDAQEAMEEMWYMIQYLSGGDKAKIFEAYKEGYMRKNSPPENTDAEWNTLENFWRD